MSKFFIVDFFYFLYFFLIKRVLVSSANRKKFKILEEFFMSLIYSRNSIGPNILPCDTPHVMNFCHNSGVSIAVFCGQQYRMLLQSPKTHYKNSSLYQAHLQFLCIQSGKTLRIASPLRTYSLIRILISYLGYIYILISLYIFLIRRYAN